MEILYTLALSLSLHLPLLPPLLVEIHAFPVHLNRYVFPSLGISLHTGGSRSWRWSGCTAASWHRLQGYLIVLVLHEAATGAGKIEGFTLSLPGLSVRGVRQLLQRAGRAAATQLRSCLCCQCRLLALLQRRSTLTAKAAGGIASISGA